MKAVFVELPAFERHRAEYLDDDAFRELQGFLMENLEAGRVVAGFQFWLFTIYGKNDMTDLTPTERRIFKTLIKAELEARRTV